ncbi:hypothetical protein MASR2M79_04970 [Aminivibrio sp.]
MGLANANTIAIGVAAGTDDAAKYAIGNKIVVHYVSFDASANAAAGANAFRARRIRSGSATGEIRQGRLIFKTERLI